MPLFDYQRFMIEGFVVKFIEGFLFTYVLMGNSRPIEGFIKGPLKSIKGLLKAYHRFIMGLSIYLSLEVCF